MARATAVSIIIPTLNERENIAPLLDAVRKAPAGVDFEVVVVDDASIDGTAAAVIEEGRQHSNVHLVQRQGKMGLSSAVLEGSAQSRGAIVVMTDADFSHDPSLPPLLVNEVQAGNALSWAPGMFVALVSRAGLSIVASAASC